MPTNPAPPGETQKHCWHTPEVSETYQAGWETSTRIVCCWCGANGYRITRRLGRDRVDGHGPFYEVVREADRIEIRNGGDVCPRKSHLLQGATEMTPGATRTLKACQHQLAAENQHCLHGLAFGTTCAWCAAFCRECNKLYPWTFLGKEDALLHAAPAPSVASASVMEARAVEESRERGRIADSLTAVVHQLRKHQASHQSWLDHFKADPNHTCGRCTPEVLAGVGDAVEQDVFVKVYDGLIERVIAAQDALRLTVRAEGEQQIAHLERLLANAEAVLPNGKLQAELSTLQQAHEALKQENAQLKRHAKADDIAFDSMNHEAVNWQERAEQAEQRVTALEAVLSAQQDQT